LTRSLEKLGWLEPAKLKNSHDFNYRFYRVGQPLAFF
jgi:hypothetical protein